MEVSVSLDPAADRDLEKYVEEINAVKGVGGVSFHCDVMDGQLVERKAMSEEQLRYVLESVHKPVDVHFMVNDAKYWIDECRKTEKLRSVSFQCESFLGNPAEAISLLERIRREKGCLAGIAVDLQTDIDKIEKKLIDAADLAVLMSVKAGKSGQKFNEQTLEKTEKLRYLKPDIRIIMDGGINLDNAERVKNAGTDVAVLGSAIYNAADRGAMISSLTEKL